MIYAIFIVVLVVAALLALRLRVKATWDERDRLVFGGVGHRNGVELDFQANRGRVKLIGIGVYGFDLDLDREEKVVKDRPVRKKRRFTGGGVRKIRTAVRMARLLPEYRRAVFTFLKGLWRAVRIEELRAEIRAGFDAPDRTGTAFGCYQALLGMAPALAGRLAFVPDWTGPSFATSGRAAVAVPLYKILWRIVVLVWQLPSKRSLKLAIEKEKGEQDVK